MNTDKILSSRPEVGISASVSIHVHPWFNFEVIHPE